MFAFVLAWLLTEFTLDSALSATLGVWAFGFAVKLARRAVLSAGVLTLMPTDQVPCAFDYAEVMITSCFALVALRFARVLTHEEIVT